MRKRNLLVIFMVMALVLFSVSQALAQAPIEGWDKAKFGMSPRDIENAFGEEMSGWNSQDETYFATSLPVRLFKGFISGASFCFVDNKLFEIKVLFVRDKKVVREVRRFWLAPTQIESFLEEKYGIPVEEKKMGERKVLRWVDVEGNGLSLMIDFEHDIENQWFEVAYFHKELTEEWEAELLAKSSKKEMEIESF